MLTAIENSSNAEVPGTAAVDITVVVTAAEDPNEKPTVTYRGMGGSDSVTIINETASFTLTLEAVGFPSTFQVLFANDLILWLDATTDQPIDRPPFIASPEPSPSLTSIKFLDTNTAIVGSDVSVKFRPKLVVQDCQDGVQLDFFRAPDPTIINVDPPGSM